MSRHEDGYLDIEMEALYDAGVREAVTNAFALAGCSWEEMQEQDGVGRFPTEVAQRASTVESSLVEPSMA